jgi:D-3-phosphoglycerate dehydrogenase
VIGYLDERFFLLPEARRRFSSAGDLRSIGCLADAAACDVLCAFHDAPVDAALIEAAPNCKVIIHNGSAILCDVEAATEHGIVVVHVPGQNARSVAEHTMALLLDVCKGLTRSDRAVRSGARWNLVDPELLTTEILGTTLGLVGFGHVAGYVARMARDGFGMSVQVWSRQEAPVRDAGFRWRSNLDDLLATSDAISLHLALNDETSGIIDADRVARFKPGAILVNTARAALVDCAALHRALVEGRVAGAGFDVWPANRPDANFVMLQSPNTVLSQHNAGYTRGAAVRSMSAALDAMQAVLRGNPPTRGRVANPEVLTATEGIRQ